MEEAVPNRGGFFALRGCPLLPAPSFFERDAAAADNPLQLE